MLKKLIAVFGMTLVFLSASVNAEETAKGLNVQIIRHEIKNVPEQAGINLKTIESFIVTFKVNQVPAVINVFGKTREGKPVDSNCSFDVNGNYKITFDFRWTTSAEVKVRFTPRGSPEKETEFTFRLKPGEPPEIGCEVF